MSFFHEAIERYECGACFGVIDAPGMQPLSTIKCPHCDVPTNVPARFGKYIIWESMRPDALFDIYLAQDTLLERAVALIIVPNENPQLRDQCLNDARRLAGLNHNWISQIYEAACVDDQWYVAAEFVSTRSALHLISEKEYITEEEALYWLKGLVSGLHDCFTHQVSMYRIRPSRLMLSPNAGLKVLDLGSELGLKQDQGYFVKPGRHYAAPEVLVGNKPTVRSSLFSLGASIYHLLAGVPPFPDGPLACTKGTSQSIKRLASMREDLSEDFRLILKRMLKRKPSERYSSAQQILHDLEALLPEDHVTLNLPTETAEDTSVENPKPDQTDQPSRPPEHWSHRVYEDSMHIEQAAATVTSLRALDIVAPTRRHGNNTISTGDLLVNSHEDSYDTYDTYEETGTFDEPAGIKTFLSNIFGIGKKKEARDHENDESLYTASLDDLKGDDSDQEEDDIALNEKGLNDLDQDATESDYTRLDDVLIDGPKTVRRNFEGHRPQSPQTQPTSKPDMDRRRRLRALRKRKRKNNPKHMLVTYLLIGINTISLLLILGSTTFGRKADEQKEDPIEQTHLDEKGLTTESSLESPIKDRKVIKQANLDTDRSGQSKSSD